VVSTKLFHIVHIIEEIAQVFLGTDHYTGFFWVEFTPPEDENRMIVGEVETFTDLSLGTGATFDAWISRFFEPMVSAFNAHPSQPPDQHALAVDVIESNGVTSHIFLDLFFGIILIKTFIVLS
jgi:hypothetical protein